MKISHRVKSGPINTADLHGNVKAVTMLLQMCYKCFYVTKTLKIYVLYMLKKTPQATVCKKKCTEIILNF